MEAIVPNRSRYRLDRLPKHHGEEEAGKAERRRSRRSSESEEKDLSVRLILYSKPGCHLCEGLQAKLAQIQSFDLDLDVRDITTRDDWFQAYQYEIPVLVLVRERGEGRGERGEEAGGVGEAGEDLTPNSKLSSEAARSATQNSKLSSSLFPLPRPSPRATVQQLERMLRQYLAEGESVGR